MGRPTKHNKKLEDQARDYINGGYENVGHAIPSIVGLARVLKIRKSTLYEWAKDKGKGFSDILAECKEAQEQELLNGGLKNEFNSNIVKLALGKHGYSDKQETDLTANLGISFNDKRGL